MLAVTCGYYIMSDTNIASIKKAYQIDRDQLLNSSPVTHLSPDDYQALKIAEAIDHLLVLPALSDATER